MSVGNCKDCKHWDQPGGAGHGGYQTCLLAATSDGCLRHLCDPPGSAQLAPVSMAKAYALDGSWYSADLITAPDFGCVQFEPK